MRIVEEIVLLMLDPEAGGVLPALSRHVRDTVIAGAVLTELALENRIDTDTERLVLVDASPMGDEMFDAVLTDIAQETATRDTSYWLARTAERSQEILQKTLSRLLADDILKTDIDGNVVLSDLVARAGLYSSAVSSDAIHLRIMRVLFTDTIPDPRDIVIVGLASVAGLLAQWMSQEEWQNVQERIETVERLDLIGRAVISAIRDSEPTEPLVRHLRSLDEIPRAPGLPLVGNSLQFLADMTQFLVRGYRELGPIYRIRILNREMIVLSGIEANHLVRQQGERYLRTYESWRGFNDATEALHLLVSMDGIAHSHLRRAMARGYSRHALDGRIQEVVDITREGMATWPVNQSIGLMHGIQPIIAEQAGQLLTGCSALPYLRDLVIYLDTLLNIHVSCRWPRFMARLPRYRRARKRVMKLYDEVRAAHESGRREGAAPDFVDDMLELNRIQPQLMPETDLPITLLSPFLVGLETSTTVCAFMLYVLLSNPDLYDQVAAEAETLFTGGDLTLPALRRLDVTHRVALETLRLYPNTPMIQRTVANSFEFEGFDIPAGKTVLIANGVTHFLPEFFPNPERVDIDRFSPPRSEHRQPGAYAPFGLGKHQCLGRGFAEMQIMITLATIVHYTDLELEHPERPLKIDSIPTPHPHHSVKFRLVRHK